MSAIFAFLEKFRGNKIVGLFMPKEESGNRVSHIYSICFKATFIPVFLVGFCWYFLRISDFYPHLNIAGVFLGWSAILPYFFILRYRKEIPPLYTGFRAFLHNTVIEGAVFLWGFIIIKSNEYLLSNPEINVSHILLLVVYAYVASIVSLTFVRIHIWVCSLF